jgi:chaperonin GroEL (HSP60 family)
LRVKHPFNLVERTPFQSFDSVGLTSALIEERAPHYLGRHPICRKETIVMTHKQLMFQSQARAKILRGASALTDAVRITVGPKFDGDFRTGIKSLRHALELPTRQTAENSGVDGGVVVDQMKKRKGSHGFDAANREYVDLMEKGIVDATKVMRVAMENAVSVASTLLFTEATLTEVPEKESKEHESIAA